MWLSQSLVGQYLFGPSLALLRYIPSKYSYISAGLSLWGIFIFHGNPRGDGKVKPRIKGYIYIYIYRRQRIMPTCRLIMSRSPRGKAQSSDSLLHRAKFQFGWRVMRMHLKGKMINVSASLGLIFLWVNHHRQAATWI